MLILIVRTCIIYVAIIVTIRLMGKRQLGELQPSELVSTILISNLASICIEEPDLPLLYSLVPVFLIAAVELINSMVIFRSAAYSRLLSGKPRVVIRNGIIDQKALCALRLTINDLLAALRGKDVFCPEEVALAVVETDGSLSILPQSSARPYLPVVADGCILQDNLDFLGLDPAWLLQQLALRQTALEEVLLLVSNGVTLRLTKMEPEGGAEA